MSNTVKGIVEFLGSKNGKTWNIKLSDGKWYGHGFKKPAFSKGDVIEFSFTESGAFLNIEIASVKVHAKPQAPVVAQAAVPNGDAAPAPATGKSGGAYWDAKDQRITFLACRNTAVEIVSLALQHDALALGTKKADKLDTLVAYVDEVARQLYAATMAGEFEPASKLSNERDADVQPAGYED